MNYPENFTTTNMDVSPFDSSQYERDLADDDLKNIVNCKEGLVEWIDNTRRTFGESPAKHYPNKKQFEDFDIFAACMEEQFDDLFTPNWHRLTKISGSIEWTVQIPSCEILRADMAKKRRLAKQRQFIRGITNPATLEAKGDAA